MRKNIIRLSVFTVVGLALCLGAFLFYWAVLDYRFFTLSPGEVYRSAAMPPNALLKKVKKYKIRTVIDFRKPCEETEREKDTLDPLGVRYINLPSKQVPTHDNIERFLSVLDDPDNKPLLLHCEHGVGRAGAFSAIYRMEYNKWENQRAIQESRWLSGFGSFGAGSNKEVFLRKYIPRWKRSP